MGFPISMEFVRKVISNRRFSIQRSKSHNNLSNQRPFHFKIIRSIDRISSRLSSSITIPNFNLCILILSSDDYLYFHRIGVKISRKGVFKMVTRNRQTAQDDDYSRSNGNLVDNLQAELDWIMREQPSSRDVISDGEKDFNIYRSGSAPPTVEGSLNAVGSLYRNSDFRDTQSSTVNNKINGGLSEDEIRTLPAYLSYYYSQENINPRLPPPMLSKEDWRAAQRFQAGSSSIGQGISDWRNKKFGNVIGDSSSLFSIQPGLSVQEQANNDLVELRKAAGRDLSRQTSAEWVIDKGSDSLVGLSGTRLGSRRKSFADIVQGGHDRPNYLQGHLSRPSSRNAFGEILETAGSQNIGTTGSHSFTPVVGSSLSRSTTPEPQLVGRSPGSGLPPVGSQLFPVEKKNGVGCNFQNGHLDLSGIAASFSGLTLSNSKHIDGDGFGQSQLQGEFDRKPDLLFDMPNGHNQSLQQQFIDKARAEKFAASENYIALARNNGIAEDNIRSSDIIFDGQLHFPKRTSSSANLYKNVNSTGSVSLGRSDSQYQNKNSVSDDYIGRSEKMNSSFNNHYNSEARAMDRGQNRMDPRFVQYLQNETRADFSPNGSSSVRNYYGNSRGDLLEFQKAYLESLLAQQNQQYDLPHLGNSGGLNHGYYGKSLYGLGIPQPRSPMSNSVSPIGSGSSMFPNEQNYQFNSIMRNSTGGSIGQWNSDVGHDFEGRFGSSLLEEFKNNKTRSFELSDIGDHVVEFSTDQYGSRFIQQKLETVTDEEKNLIFPEIIPHARTLMTDVFGNYVIQKFFEHGTESQRKELTSHLSGHVLPLSLQMYGCRVIQKALEVVDTDHKIQMVEELDGSVIKCVRDQNGNHVIQKCIECVPQDKIQFIISAFYGQVVALSSHPYGCRVIQRVLEHCDDLRTQQIIMEEVMQSVCTLAQDQYGNYVIQHVLQHGKPHERSAIISKLAGQIVKMSLQKFASNVIEKSLTYGGPKERQLLVKEMLGMTDENEPLQAMMKDQFGNYVVQKVLETCDDQSLELIVSRIKVHLNTLKRYTYGKHIVSRVEKLIATGERRIGLSASHAF